MGFSYDQALEAWSAPWVAGIRASVFFFLTEDV